MTVSTRVINFDVTQFNGVEFGIGKTTLLITPRNSFASGTSIVPNSTISAIPNASGQGTVSLVPTSLARPNTPYRCVILVSSIVNGKTEYVEHDFGQFAVPDTAGPFNLSDLIVASIPV